MAAGFDAVVNERANAMTWPRGQMRYNLATLAELRTFRPLSYTLVPDGPERRLDPKLVAIGNGPSFGGGLRIAEGAVLDDGLLDDYDNHLKQKQGEHNLIIFHPKQENEKNFELLPIVQF